MTSSIQAALEAQKKMLAAKAGSMPAPPPEPVTHVDPAVTLALARARAAALMTCQESSEPLGPMQAIANARGMLQSRLPAEPAPGALLLGKGWGKGASMAIGGGLLAPMGMGKVGPSSLSGFGGGRPQWGGGLARPPLRGMPQLAGGMMGPLGGKGIMPKLGAEQLQGSLSTKARPPGGPAAKQQAAAGLGNLAAMKEVSPALAALMQGKFG